MKGKYINATYPVEIKKSRKHRFFVEARGCYIDGEDVEQEYPFTNDVNRIALVKSPFDNCVLIITSSFNVRYGIWTNVEEAKEALTTDDIVAHCVTINGKKEYIISNTDDFIEDVSFNLVDIKHIDEDFEETIVANYNVPIKGSKKHKFSFELTEDYFDSANIDSTFLFNKDFDKIAIVETPLYPKVLLITQRFKLILTNWNNKQEALKNIRYDELEAHYVHIEGNPICFVADTDENLSNIYLQIPQISPISLEDDITHIYKYSKPEYYEEDTPYSKQIRKLICPYFSDIQKISSEFIAELPYRIRQELFEKLNHGVKIMTNKDLLHAYMFSYGKMHEAKLTRSFREIPQKFFKTNSNIEIIDYACGQGIATICLQEYIDDEDINVDIKRICLIDPSAKALSRAALLCHKICPKSEIETIKSTFDELDKDEIPSSKLGKIHLLSNILDMDCYDIEHLADIINGIKKKGDLFICVDPLYHNPKYDGRQKKLMNLLKGKIIYNERFNANELIKDKSWTANITIFKV